MSKVSKNNHKTRQEISLSASLLSSAKCVDAVLRGRSLSDCLNGIDTNLRPSVQAISFHVLRNLGYAQAARQVLVKKIPKKSMIDALLIVAISLLEASMRNSKEGVTTENIAKNINEKIIDAIPIYTSYTIVDQAVKSASGKLKIFKGLINATLRNYIRQRDSVLNICQKNETAVFNYPVWWINQVKSAYPKQWQEILQAGNQHAPLILRVNKKISTAENIIELLSKYSLPVVKLSDTALYLPNPVAITSIPGFTKGLWSVQDISAQQAGSILQIENGAYVLDACSAPGGKTAHILEQSEIKMLALDSDQKRLNLVQSNLNRLQLNNENVSLKCADASDISAWWDGKPFDYILLDAPCTGSGIVRRHPDIRWLRRPEDISQAAALQNRLLNSLWQTLKPGGKLLYVTCSIFPQEGKQQAQDFLLSNKDAAREDNIGQILPLPYSYTSITGDGFFYALFRKSS